MGCLQFKQLNMKSLFSQDLYIRAWNFASSAHMKQTLPGSEIPYINHIGNVAMEITAAITVIPVELPDLSIQCALLHDVIEDTEVTYDMIETEFGIQVAQGVLSLTKNKKLPSKQEQMLDSLNRIKQQPREVWMVKLADRITNLQPPPHFWVKEKIAKYHNESKLIHNHLGTSHRILSDRLDQKILEYQKLIE
jgi:(p)ppGpp synthase/HD superfamily hydrolase